MVRGKPLSDDLRQQVIIKVCHNGQSGCQIAQQLNLSRHTVTKIIISNYKNHRQHKNKSKLGRIPKANKADIYAVCEV